ncbi:hypothetical protein ACFOKI_06490 [Sphingomonas qilianensis]|uniref:Protein TonB n=1 Tax=Sphingomonas qilianensis TaxID=1736690 RepID=A0ABU9XR54_9SPHN
MPSASYQSTSKRRRAIGLALAIGAHLLVLIVMLTMAPKFVPEDKKEPTAFTMFDVAKPVPDPGPKAVEVEKKKTTSSSGAPGRAPTPQPAKAPPAPPTPPTPTLIGGRELFEAADISNLPQRGGGDAGAAQGKDSGSVYGPGAGPGGERMYEAEWEREPTKAEMAFYMQGVNRQEGWGLVACKTIPGNRVENCRSLGESPLGAGIARAMRQAAWQFRVLPPRIGGRPQIGVWVRIRFDIINGVPTKRG